MADNKYNDERSDEHKDASQNTGRVPSNKESSHMMSLSNQFDKLLSTLNISRKKLKEEPTNELEHTPEENRSQADISIVQKTEEISAPDKSLKTDSDSRIERQEGFESDLSNIFAIEEEESEKTVDEKTGVNEIPAKELEFEELKSDEYDSDIKLSDSVIDDELKEKTKTEIESAAQKGFESDERENKADEEENVFDVKLEEKPELIVEESNTLDQVDLFKVQIKDEGLPKDEKSEETSVVGKVLKDEHDQSEPLDVAETQDKENIISEETSVEESQENKGLGEDFSKHVVFDNNTSTSLEQGKDADDILSKASVDFEKTDLNSEYKNNMSSKEVNTAPNAKTELIDPDLRDIAVPSSINMAQTSVEQKADSQNHEYVFPQQVEVDKAIKKDHDIEMSGIDKIDYDKVVGNNKLMSIEAIYGCKNLINKVNESVFMIEIYSKTLPENLPTEVKRQSVLNILKASSLDADKLLGDAYKRIDVLNEVLEDVAIKASDLNKQDENTISDLEDKIKALKVEMQKRSQYQQAQNTMIGYEIQRIVNIVEFINPK